MAQIPTYRGEGGKQGPAAPWTGTAGGQTSDGDMA